MVAIGVRGATRRRAAAATALALAVAGCGSGGSSTGPSPTITRVAYGTPVREQGAVNPAQVEYLRQHGLTPREQISVGAGGTPLAVYWSLCTGSADGHCGSLDAFAGGAPRPVWSIQATGVSGLHSTAGGFSVTTAGYAPGDPLCCPSRPPTTRRYAWDGQTVRLAAGSRG